MKLQDVFSHFRADITIASDMGIKHFTASCWKADGIVWKFPHEYWVFARFWQSFVLWHAGKKGLFQRLFVRNRKFTFYPLPIHKRVVHYPQSKDKDRPPILPPIPSQSKASAKNAGAFDFWMFCFLGEAFLWKSTPLSLSAFDLTFSSVYSFLAYARFSRATSLSTFSAKAPGIFSLQYGIEASSETIAALYICAGNSDPIFAMKNSKSSIFKERVFWTPFTKLFKIVK